MTYEQHKPISHENKFAPVEWNMVKEFDSTNATMATHSYNQAVASWWIKQRL